MMLKKDRKRRLVISAALLSVLFLAGSVLGFKGVSKPVAAEKLSIEFPELTLSVCEANGQELKIIVEGDKAKAEAAVYEDFGGVILCFDRDKVRFLNASVEYQFGLLQYLTDDKRATPVEFKVETEWTDLEIEGQSILIPQTNDNLPGVKNIFQQLGYDDRDDFTAQFIQIHFNNVKYPSLKHQKAFYESLLKNDREKYTECCPEYIEQAEAFLGKQLSDFNSLEDLGLELYRARTTIRLTGTTLAGKNFTYYIVDEN